jgi:hypothetical protein
MSNMKEVLGDMTLEEFEAKRKLVLEKLKDISFYEIDEEYCADARDLYDCWLEIQGKEYTQKWVKYNGTNGQINTEQVNVLIKELIFKFKKWLESFE